MPHSDPPQEDQAFGARLRHYRIRAGISRPTLALLIGRSPDWVKRVENGNRGEGIVDSTTTLLRAASVLGVDLNHLIGRADMPAPVRTPQHHLLDDVTGALARHHTDIANRQPRPPEVLARSVDFAWRMWHTTIEHRSAVARDLPRLIRDARVAIAVYPDPEFRPMLQTATRIFALAHLYLTFQTPMSRPMYTAAEWAVGAAQAAHDPCTLAAAQWTDDHVQREAGVYDAEPAMEVATLLHPEEGGEDLAMWGLMRLSAALSCSLAGRKGDALRHWDQARCAARRLGPGYTHRWLLFNAAMVDAFGVWVHVNLGCAAEALQLAGQVDTDAIPSRSRRAFLASSTAQAYLMQRDESGVMRSLEQAQWAAPEDFVLSPYVRAMIAELREADTPQLQRRRERLADAAGIGDKGTGVPLS